MEPQELAKAGVWLLKKAVIDYLATQPEGVSAFDLRRAMGYDPRSDAVEKVFWGIELMLIAEGDSYIDRNFSPQRSKLTQKPDVPA